MIPRPNGEPAKEVALAAKPRAEIVSLIRRDLEVSTSGQDHVARLVWLFQNLEDYLDRWTIGLQLFSMRDFLENALHKVLTAAVDLIEEELNELKECEGLKQQWRGFGKAVRMIDKATDKSVAIELRTQFELACVELGSVTTDPKRKTEQVRVLSNYLVSEIQSLDGNAGVAYLFSRLDDYFFRWTWWLAHPFSMSGFPHERYLIVCAVVELIEQRRHLLNWSVLLSSKWEQFAIAIREKGQTIGEDGVGDLKRLYAIIRSQV
jgi:hypothetical protein